MINIASEVSLSVLSEFDKATLNSPILYAALQLETSPISALAVACIELVKQNKKLQEIAVNSLETRTRPFILGGVDD